MVDVYKRGCRYYYFAYPEDYSKTLVEFYGQENQLQRKTHRPVFQVVFVVDPENGKFSIYYHGQSATIHDIQEIFAHEILVTNLPDSINQNVYFTHRRSKHSR